MDTDDLIFDAIAVRRPSFEVPAHNVSNGEKDENHEDEQDAGEGEGAVVCFREELADEDEYNCKEGEFEMIDSILVVKAIHRVILEIAPVGLSELGGFVVLSEDLLNTAVEPWPEQLEDNYANERGSLDDERRHPLDRQAKSTSG